MSSSSPVSSSAVEDDDKVLLLAPVLRLLFCFRRFLKQIPNEKPWKLHHKKVQDICYKLTLGAKHVHDLEDDAFLFGLSKVESSISLIFPIFPKQTLRFQWYISIQKPDTTKPLYPLKALSLYFLILKSLLPVEDAVLSYDFLKKSRKSRPQGRDLPQGRVFPVGVITTIFCILRRSRSPLVKHQLQELLHQRLVTEPGLYFNNVFLRELCYFFKDLKTQWWTDGALNS